MYRRRLDGSRARLKIHSRQVHACKTYRSAIAPSFCNHTSDTNIKHDLLQDLCNAALLGRNIYAGYWN